MPLICRACRVVVKCIRGSCSLASCKHCDKNLVGMLVKQGLVPVPLPQADSYIALGVDEDGAPVTIPVDLVWKHIGILGSTGSGKTVTATKIVEELWLNGVPVIVLDWNGEYKRALEDKGVDVAYFEKNSLPAMPLLCSSLPLEAVADTLKHSLRLSEHQAAALTTVLALIEGLTPMAALRLFSSASTQQLSVIEEAVAKARAGNSVLDLIEVVEAAWSLASSKPLLAYSRAEIEVWSALVRRLEPLVYSRDSKLIKIRGNDAEKLVNKSTGSVVVLDVSGIVDPKVKRIYVSLTLGALYDIVRHRRNSRLIVVVEEAHNILEHAPKLVTYILAEARKHQLGLTLVSSRPELLGSEVVLNINTLIIHRGGVPSTAHPLAKIINPREAGALGVGEALLVTPLTATPTRIRITA